MPAAKKTDRTTLDNLNAAANLSFKNRASAEVGSVSWTGANRLATMLEQQASAERMRLFKMDPWGKWMTPADRVFANQY